MSQSHDSAEEQRMQRLRSLMDKAIAADLEVPQVLPLIGTVYEAAVKDIPGPSRRAMVRAVEAGLVLLEFEGSPPEQYWVPVGSIQWLKVVR